ncbi:hypothetical protein ACLOJK_033490 [Asimina triloba]
MDNKFFFLAISTFFFPLPVREPARRQPAVTGFPEQEPLPDGKRTLLAEAWKEEKEKTRRKERRNPENLNICMDEREETSTVIENPNQDGGIGGGGGGGGGGSGGGGGGERVASSSSFVLVGKKKRGRPRKYGPDGRVPLTLSPMPISSSGPAAALLSSPEAGSGEFISFAKRGRGRPPGSQNKPRPPRIEFDFSGEWVASSGGANFTPHIITVATGEDVTMKIISFSQQMPGAICILSANGAVSNVTLRQPDSSGGTLTYEGRFEILSLSGSFMAVDSGGTRSRTGGMSVSLASPDGRVLGGGVAGLLVAACPVVVGHFIPVTQLEMKPKKPRFEFTPATTTAAVPISSVNMNDTYPVEGQQNSKSQKLNLAVSSSFRGESWPLNSAQTDINVSLPEG